MSQNVAIYTPAITLTQSSRAQNTWMCWFQGLHIVSGTSTLNVDYMCEVSFQSHKKSTSISVFKLETYIFLPRKTKTWPTNRVTFIYQLSSGDINIDFIYMYMDTLITSMLNMPQQYISAKVKQIIFLTILPPSSMWFIYYYPGKVKAIHLN